VTVNGEEWRKGSCPSHHRPRLPLGRYVSRENNASSFPRGSRAHTKPSWWREYLGASISSVPLRLQCPCDTPVADSRDVPPVAAPHSPLVPTATTYRVHAILNWISQNLLGWKRLVKGSPLFGWGKKSQASGWSSFIFCRQNIVATDGRSGSAYNKRWLINPAEKGSITFILIFFY